MIREKIKAAIKKYGLIKKGDKVVAGVSGGPDSVALLYLLNSLKDELGFKLYAAHLDHMLRPHSYQDAEYVRKITDELGVPLKAVKINIGKLAKKGSLEEVARKARLEFLFDTAKAFKAGKIALGHNLDDQAETVLMRLIRGSGLYGLSAILPKRKFSRFTLIRPLINIKRKEIEAYLKKKKIRFCVDETNKEGIYLRNKLRHKLLPLLEKEYNKNIKDILSNTALTVGYDYDYLSGVSAKASRWLGKNISLRKLARLHPAIQNLVLRLNIACLKGDTRRIDFKHIEEIMDMALNRPVGSIVDLPKGVSVIKKKACLVFFLNETFA